MRILESFAGKILTFIAIVLCRIDQIASIKEVREKVKVRILILFPFVFCV